MQVSKQFQIFAIQMGSERNHEHAVIQFVEAEPILEMMDGQFHPLLAGRRQAGCDSPIELLDQDAVILRHPKMGRLPVQELHRFVRRHHHVEQTAGRFIVRQHAGLRNATDLLFHDDIQPDELILQIVCKLFVCFNPIVNPQIHRHSP